MTYRDLPGWLRGRRACTGLYGLLLWTIRDLSGPAGTGDDSLDLLVPVRAIPVDGHGPTGLFTGPIGTGIDLSGSAGMVMGPIGPVPVVTGGHACRFAWLNRPVPGPACRFVSEAANCWSRVD